MQEIWYYLCESHIKWRELDRFNQLREIVIFLVSFEKKSRLNKKLTKLDKSYDSFRSSKLIKSLVSQVLSDINRND